MKQLVALALALAMPCIAGAADDSLAERARIRAERARAESAYAAAARDCNARFVVTSCVEDARAERRQTLTRLRNEELVLDRAERKQRAAERAQAIRHKQAQEDRPRPRLVVPQAAGSDPRPRLHLRVPGAPTAAGHRPPRLTPEEESRNRAVFEQRQREAEAHREAVERRNAERAAKAKKPSRALPVPPPEGASAPSR